MKYLPHLILKGLVPALAAAGGVSAGTFTADFNNALTPDGAFLFSNNGGGVIEAAGGAGNSGCLKLTKSVNSQSGGMVVQDLDAGEGVNGFTATWQMRMGGGTNPPADGASFSVGAGLNGGGGPEGEGGGLRVAFDTFNNSPPEQPAEAPAVDIYWNNAVIAHRMVPIATLRTNADFVPVTVKLDPDGSLDVTYNGQAIYSNLFIGNFLPIAGAQYAWSAATGGLNENHFVDDISLTTTTGVVNPGITLAPRSMTVLEGSPAYFLIGVSDGSAVQWQRKGPADAAFADIGGETATLLATPPAAAADNGTQYRAIVSLNGIDLATEAVTLSTATLPPPATAERSFNFNDGLVPAGTTVRGSAIALATGGTGDSGQMELTTAENGKNGGWFVPDSRSGAAVDGLFAQFRLNMTPADGAVPADGFGFHFAPDLPAGDLPSELAAGTGLSVGFDVYDNGGGEAPAVDVFWHGVEVASVKYPALLLNTRGEFADVRIRMEPDGTLDVSFNGIVVFNNLALPGFYPVSGGQMAFSARTGGLNQRHAVDDVSLTTQLFNGPVAVVRQPADTAIVKGYAATFTTATNDPARTSFQWQRREPGGADFANIPGATASSYTTPVTAFPGDNQAAYRAVLTSSNGSSATSNPATLTVVDQGRPSPAQVIYDFNTGAAANTGTLGAAVTAAVLGNSTVTANGGVGDSGVLHITDDTGGQTGAMVIPDFNGGTSVGSFKASFAIRSASAGTPADGWSFSWGTGLPTAAPAGELEQGIGNDLRISFDVYDNTDGNPNNLPPGEAPAIDIFWRGTELAHAIVPMALLQTGTAYEQVHIEVAPDGKVTVSQDGIPVHAGVQIPGFAGVAGAGFAFAGRTGGSSAAQWVDDVAIQTEPYLGPISFNAQPPASVSIAENSGVTVSVVVNDPARTSFQWQRKLPGEADFSNITGATATSYDTPALTAAQSGVQYRAVATAATNSITSSALTVNVFALGLPATPNLTLDFNDSQLPAGSSTHGNTLIVGSEGVDDSPFILLTDAVDSQSNSFILDDQDFGFPVSAMTAEFSLRIDRGSAVPADGVGFSWGTGIPDGAFREEGAGNDLRIGFDTYDNGGGEAPSIKLIWRNERVATANVPLDLLMDPEFVQVVVRVNAGGTCDVVYDNQIIFWNVPLPGWAPLSAARFAWSGATGGQWARQSLDNIRLTTSTASIDPSINVTSDGTSITISFMGQLQTSTDLSSPWEDVSGATSPLVLPLTEGRRFWRAVIP